MPTIAQVREAIRAKLAGVAGIGVVNDYERYAVSISEFKAFFVAAGQVKGWLIRRAATQETSPALGRYVVTHRWQLRGYMALDDSAGTEKTFDTLVEAVRDAFRADETLGSVVAATVIDGEAGIQVEDSGPVMLAGVLCHGVRLKLSTRHYQ